MSTARTRPSRKRNGQPKIRVQLKVASKKTQLPRWKRTSLLRGIIFILVGGILILTPVFVRNHKLPDILSNNFAGEPVKIDESLSGDTQGESPIRILIPDVSIDITIKFAPIQNGYWIVYKDSAGFGQGSSLPGEQGNIVIFAHARQGLFLPLNKVKLGTKIYILSINKYFSYQVSDIKEVNPNQIEVISQTPQETLTLYTCSGFLDKKRLIVIAKPT